MNSSRRGQLIIGSLVSLVLLGWVLWQTDWGEVARALRDANYALLALSFLMVAIGVPLRALRWRTMLTSTGDAAPFGEALDAVAIGYLANNILPARLGDVLRAYLVTQWTPIRFPFALSTTVVERVLDTLVVVGLLFGMLPFLPVPPAAARTGTVMGVLILLAGVGLVIAAWQRDLSARLIGAVLRPLPINSEVWTERLTSLLDGFAIVRKPIVFAQVLAWSAIIWAVAIAGYWFAFRAFDLPLGPTAGAFTISLGALGMALPSGPASAGTYDSAAAGALVILGVSEKLAGGLAVVLHTLNFLAITAVGLWSMARRGLSFASLSQQSDQAAASAADDHEAVASPHS